MIISHYFAGLSFAVIVLDRFFFHLGDKKKWSLVALDRWLSYTVMGFCLGGFNIGHLRPVVIL